MIAAVVFASDENVIPGHPSWFKDSSWGAPALRGPHMFNRLARLNAERQAREIGDAGLVMMQKAADDDSLESYVQGAINKACAAIENADKDNRNNVLNKQAGGLGQLVGAKVLKRDRAEAALTKAALKAGLGAEEIKDTIKSGLDWGEKTPRDLSKIGKGRARGDSPAVRIWKRCKPINGTLAEVYLTKRGIELPFWPGSLGFAHLCNKEAGGDDLPALVGMATVKPFDDQIVAVQRTWLNADGSWKAEVPTPRKALGKYGGAAIWFGTPGPRLIITEGIENALSALASGEEFVAAAIGGTNIGNIVPPDGVREIIVFGDRAKDGKGDGTDPL